MRNIYKTVSGFVFIIIAASLISCNSAGSDDSKIKNNNTLSRSDVAVGVEIGNRAPDLVFRSPEGEKVSLSSLRGKLVLIDFWASWCSPCRRDNPQLVKIYKKYREKSFVNAEGFSIYGVSLDKDRETWIRAIKQDNLPVENQVSDLKGTASEPAAIYGIMAIPANFLIDGNGIIIAKNLHGEFLEDQLKSILK